MLRGRGCALSATLFRQRGARPCAWGGSRCPRPQPTRTHASRTHSQCSRQAREYRRRANVCRPRMRGGSPPREGRNSPCVSVNTLRTAARNLARQHEGRLVQCTRIRVCTGGVRGACSTRVSHYVYGPLELASSRPSVDRHMACGSCVELYASTDPRTVHGEGPEWYRSRSADDTCMYVCTQQQEQQLCTPAA